MLQLDFPIQDVHGNILPAAVIVVNSLNYQAGTSNHSYVNFDSVNGLSDRIENPSQNISLGFNALVWRDITAFNKKKTPMTFRSPEGTEWFNVPLTSPLHESEIQIMACESYLLDHVLPAMETE